jgi:hypothetical protein
MDNSFSSDKADATVTRGAGVEDTGSLVGQFIVDCFDIDGNLKWTESFKNTVSNQGKAFSLDQTFGGTSVNSRMAIFVGGSVTTASTYSVPLFTEAAGTVCSVRATPTWSAAVAGATTSKATTATTFSIVAAAATTITGAAIVAIGNAAVGNLGVAADTVTATSVCYAGGTFATGKSVTSGDTLNVTYTTNLT